MARSQTVTVRTGGSGIDTSDFRAVAKALRQAQPELARELRKSLRKAGEIVAVEARSLAEKDSKSIPPTIKVRVASATVSVVAGGKDAPVAGLFELGNTGGSKSASASRKGVFRHPVFGNRDVWVNQPMHRFLAPAAASRAMQVERAVLGALDQATRTIVFGGEHA